MSLDLALPSLAGSGWLRKAVPTAVWRGFEFGQGLCAYHVFGNIPLPLELEGGALCPPGWGVLRVGWWVLQEPG